MAALMCVWCVHECVDCLPRRLKLDDVRYATHAPNIHTPTTLPTHNTILPTNKQKRIPRPQRLAQSGTSLVPVVVASRQLEASTYNKVSSKSVSVRSKKYSKIRWMMALCP